MTFLSTSGQLKTKCWEIKINLVLLIKLNVSARLCILMIHDGLVKHPQTRNLLPHCWYEPSGMLHLVYVKHVLCAVSP